MDDIIHVSTSFRWRTDAETVFRGIQLSALWPHTKWPLVILRCQPQMFIGAQHFGECSLHSRFHRAALHNRQPPFLAPNREPAENVAAQDEERARQVVAPVDRKQETEKTPDRYKPNLFVRANLLERMRARCLRKPIEQCEHALSGSNFAAREYLWHLRRIFYRKGTAHEHIRALRDGTKWKESCV